MAALWRYWRKYVGDTTCKACGTAVFMFRTHTGNPTAQPVVLSVCPKCDELEPRRV